MPKSAVLCLAAALTPWGAHAQEARPVVVELYTSQGCSSCPPADALLAELAGQKGVVALALHVDYWDYLGWRDTFASPGFTARQHAYARHQGEKMVYTPQMVVNGGLAIVGTDRAALAAAVAAGGAPGPDLKIARAGGQITIRARSDQPLPGSVTVVLVEYIPLAKVEVERGENAGRTLSYTNVVSRWDEVGRWDGSAPLDLSEPVSSDRSVAVLLQEPGPGAVLAAATVP